MSTNFFNSPLNWPDVSQIKPLSIQPRYSPFHENIAPLAIKPKYCPDDLPELTVPSKHVEKQKKKN